jgi:DNA polymerase-1
MQKKIYILDGSGYIFRSYFGVPPLYDASGQNVNCVYGMAKIIIRLLADKPDGIVVARDSPTKTFRHNMDDTYKANRPKPPEDLRTQYLLVRELVDSLGIPNITAP